MLNNANLTAEGGNVDEEDDISSKLSEVELLARVEFPQAELPQMLLLHYSNIKHLIYYSKFEIILEF